MPASGATFTVLSATSLTGSFSNVPSGTIMTMGGDYLGVYYGSGLTAPNSVTVLTLIGSGIAWNNSTGGTWGTDSNWTGGTAPAGTDPLPTSAEP